MSVHHLAMGRHQRLTDGIWTVDVLVDEDGHLNIWVSASDDGSPLGVCDSGADIADDDRSWAERFYYRKDN